MSFLQPNDEQTLQRLLGVEILPDTVLAECQLRTQMYHRSGGTGPLGPLALIDLVRFLGLRPAIPESAAAATDWRSMPSNGSVRVEGKFFGDWRPGVYLGLIEHGTLAVKFDDDPMIRECRPDMLRLAKVTDTVSANPDSQDVPDARAGLLKASELNPRPAEPPVLPVAAAAGIDPDYDRDIPSDLPSEGETPAWKSKDPVDWSSLAEGDPVWVDLRGDIEDGTFVRQAEDGSLIVSVGGVEIVSVAGAVNPVNAPVCA